MKVVVAPDKFAGTLSAAQAAAAIAAGWSATRPQDEVIVVPMADGGEGTLEVVEAIVDDVRRHELEVADARGRPVRAAWLLLPDGRALVEAAEACGLKRLDPSDRDPLLATTYGVGQLLRAAADAGAREIVVGLGGSATVDGGAGCVTALGHRLLRPDGNGVKVGARFLVDLDRVVAGPGLGAPVVAAVDVTHPLLGPGGAAAVFAPQKGADEQGVGVLETALERFADVTERDLDGGPWRHLPGSGAAGGMAFGLAAYCGARLVTGAEVVGRLVGLDDAVRDAAVVITGEGSLDRHSEAGKVPAHVRRLAREHRARALAVAGRIEDGVAVDFDAAVDLGPEGMQRAAELVEERAAGLAASL